MKRALLAVAALVLVAAGVGIYVLLTNLNLLVERAIERYGSEITGTSVGVGSVAIGLREGRGSVRNLTVGNPDGFDADDVFAWDEVVLDIDPQSVTKQPYVVDEVKIQAPRVVFEVNEQGQVNLKVLQDRLKSGGGAGGGGAGGGGEQPRLRIRQFTFEKGAAEVRAASVGGKDLRVDLPPLRLSNVGGNGGATASEIGRAVLLAYTEQVLRSVGRRELGRRAGDLIDKELEGEEAEAAKRLLDRVLTR